MAGAPGHAGLVTKCRCIHGTVTLRQEALPSPRFAQQAREGRVALPGLRPATQGWDVPSQLTPELGWAPSERSLPPELPGGHVLSGHGIGSGG